MAEATATTMKSLRTLLVANRGEIACRLIRAAKRLGIKCIAIYSAADSASLHVMLADQAFLLNGESRAVYLDGEQIVQIAKANRVNAIVPGYGFLSENMAFAAAVEQAGMIFVGPSPETIEVFGLKHVARNLAVKAGVPIVPGTQGLVETEAEALENARRIGFPIMLKATGGGGGMGLMVCNDDAEVSKNFAMVKSRGETLFKNAGVLMERYFPTSHHIEVQLFGNGLGQVVSVGERECSIQRRHQKVVEEAPSPLVELRYPALRTKLCECAVRLAESVNYRSAGTVEFLVDSATGDFFFLEMNTRLQVEHGITELVYGVDLVEMMYQQADAQLNGSAAFDQQEAVALQERLKQPRGHAIEVRVYAENPIRNFAPSSGILQQVDWHEVEGTRIDTWIRAGNTIGLTYDPMLAKVMQYAPTRQEAITTLQSVLTKSSIRGLTLNIGFLLAIIADQRFIEGDTPTAFLNEFKFVPAAIDVLSGGALTLIQDFPGRPSVGHGFGHAGPMDPIAFQVANALVGNDVGTEGLEITMNGPELLFLGPAIVSLCGPKLSATLDGKDFPLWTRVSVASGQKLVIGELAVGCRAYLAIQGGLPGIASWFGSKATSSGSHVGGLQGRALRAGDLLDIIASNEFTDVEATWNVPQSVWPRYSSQWDIQAMPGPYETGYLSQADIDMVYSQGWKISHNAARSGIRLIGPAPEFGRADGGDGGSHPSNVIEYGYPIGGLNWTGGQSVIFPVDSPDFGGFICSLTVTKGDWWKLGQVRPGDTIKFQRVDLATALETRKTNDEYIRGVVSALKSGSWEKVIDFNRPVGLPTHIQESPDVVKMVEETPDRPRVVYRAGGDSFLLVDYGHGKTDLNHKCRVIALKKELEQGTGKFGLRHLHDDGALLNLVSCGNSLMIYFESLTLSREELVHRLTEIDDSLGSMHHSIIPNRRFKLPLVFTHHSLDESLRRYMANQRPYAAYLPDTLDFVAQNNGITVQEVKDLFLSLEAVVVGCGFLMALPQTLPNDPRHRINVPKMNPSRISTPPGTVSWGGTGIAIYTHDSPGGYMLTGLTIPGLDVYGYKAGFSQTRPWLFEDLDVITFYEVTTEEYDQKLADFEAGTYEWEFADDSFSLAAHNQLVIDTADEVKSLQEKRLAAQQTMAEKEKRLYEQWMEEKTAKEAELGDTTDLANDPALVPIKAPNDANVWRLLASEGQTIKASQSLLTLEAMKMEIEVLIPKHLDGSKVERIVVAPNQTVESGQVLAFLRPSGDSMTTP